MVRRQRHRIVTINQWLYRWRRRKCQRRTCGRFLPISPFGIDQTKLQRKDIWQVHRKEQVPLYEQKQNGYECRTRLHQCNTLSSFRRQPSWGHQFLQSHEVTRLAASIQWPIWQCRLFHVLFSRCCSWGRSTPTDRKVYSLPAWHTRCHSTPIPIKNDILT